MLEIMQVLVYFEGNIFNLHRYDYDTKKYTVWFSMQTVFLSKIGKEQKILKKTQNSHKLDPVRTVQVGMNNKSHRQFKDVFSQWHHEHTL